MGGRIFAIGESILDIILKDGQVQAARPGGSMLNSAVSLGRAGMPVYLLTEMGQDPTGDLIVEFLKKNQIRTHFIYRYTKGKTPLAMAFLNKDGDATYDFYKFYPEERLELTLPEFNDEDILLFGSYFGIDPRIRTRLMQVVHAAHRAGALIVYDPNFRRPHAHELDQLKPFILENMEMAQIIRASHEDVEIIFGEGSMECLKANTRSEDKILVLTRASEGAEISLKAFSKNYPVSQIKVVSTIGAGDNFNAGMIYGLMKQGITRATLSGASPRQWDAIMAQAIGFSADVCQHLDNYISKEFAASLQTTRIRKL